MTGEFFIELVVRWVHILSAIVAVGGAVFFRLILMPAVGSALSDEEHGRLHPVVMRRWTIFLHATILLFLLSGLYAYFGITRFRHVDQPLYHALFGIKFLLAMGVIALAIGLTSRSELFAALRTGARLWWGVLVVTAVLVVLVAGVMRTLPETAARAEPAVQVDSGHQSGG